MAAKGDGQHTAQPRLIQADRASLRTRRRRPQVGPAGGPQIVRSLTGAHAHPEARFESKRFTESTIKLSLTPTLRAVPNCRYGYIVQKK